MYSTYAVSFNKPSNSFIFPDVKMGSLNPHSAQFTLGSNLRPPSIPANSRPWSVWIFLSTNLIVVRIYAKLRTNLNSKLLQNVSSSLLLDARAMSVQMVPATAYRLKKSRSFYSTFLCRSFLKFRQTAI